MSGETPDSNAVRPPVGTLWGRLLLEPLADRLAPLLVRTGLTPLAVTGLAFLLGLLSAALFRHGAVPALVLGAVLYQTATLADALDGRLARLRPGSGSILALVADHVLDTARIVLNVLALAYGQYARGADATILLWAAVFLCLHFLDWTLPRTVAKARGAYRTLYPPRASAGDGALLRLAKLLGRVRLKVVCFGTHEREVVVLLLGPLLGAIAGALIWGSLLTALFFLLRLRLDLALVKRELLHGTREYLGDAENPWESGPGGAAPPPAAAGEPEGVGRAG